MTNRKSNKLINQKSPYLLQHAHNPVDWYTWGEEAFVKAKQKGRECPISFYLWDTPYQLFFLYRIDINFL